jgi:5'-nucleotidase/UDP-sugar diphosphatase
VILIPSPSGAASVDEEPASAPPLRPAPRAFVVNPADGATAGPAAGGREVVVQKGDSLYKIAEAQWGDGSLWTRIRDANPGVDPNRLRPGTVLRMPAAE